MKKKQYKILTLILAIILCCFFSTIAYSAVYSTMNVTGIAYARVVKDVRITDFKINDLSFSATTSYEEFSSNTISSKFNLIEPASSMIFDVEVTNYGSSDVGILNLIGTLPEGLSYEIINYNLEDKICDDTGKCNQMAVKTFQIKFTGTPGEYEITQELDFRTYHKVTYTGITNNNYPTKVIDGGNLNITFTENLKKVTILSDGTEIAQYDQISSGQTITIENVSSDIEFKRTPPVAKLVSGKIDEVGSEVCIKDECFYIISNDGSTVTMLAKYNLYVGYMYNESYETLELENPTGKQSSDAIGYRRNDDGALLPFIGVVPFSNSADIYTYDESIIKTYVDDYNIYLSTYSLIDNARLITEDEVNLLKDYDWLYTSSFWTESTLRDFIVVVKSSGIIDSGVATDDMSYGVRPVIEMSVDEIHVEPAAKVVSGDYDTVGSEVAIGDEHFYVISSTDDTVTMLAKYNLYVGNECGTALNSCTSYGEEATGIQDSTMLGWGSTSPYRGVIEFSNVSCNYSGSIVEGYVNNYHSYLITQNITPIETRLISFDELTTLGCSCHEGFVEICSCEDSYNWTYTTTYWTGTCVDSSYVWEVNRFGGMSKYDYTFNDQVGVRPVITISKSNF